ncbi:MarR family winged helix-turn-helix transcriptional regulator [Cellulomonas hominis]|uniref:MarR family winged helix-turn-helix transcriptional regulator n=1 Tax=Cellulomonas hominis TaxID=156981 RepID=UPI001B9B9460|nr:MarR family transcriptional regulator [Cellulomonas hominis]VTR76003.1 HTH-type transcriptional repressor NicR [Cellulomonas hominis]
MGERSEERSDRTRTIRELVFALSRELAEEVREAVTDLNLTTTQANVIRDLGAPMTQKQLAGALCCEPSNVTFVVDKLETRGLVERRPHPTDRRSKVLHLTDEGRAVRTAMIDRFEARTSLGAMSDAEREQLEVLLRRASSGR